MVATRKGVFYSMNSKLRIVPIILTAVLSAGLLFGGWFLYKQVVVAGPLEEALREVPGVVSGKPVIDADHVNVHLNLAPDADLREVYERIVTQGAPAIGDRKVRLFIEDSEDAGLETIWSTVLFDVAEAMETRRYSKIPAALKELEQAYPGFKASTEIDADNVYITMRRGDAVKHVVLPRIPDTLGVWPNA